MSHIWAEPPHHARNQALPPRRVAPPPGAPFMINVFADVGEHRRDPDYRLGRGGVGASNGWVAPTGQTIPTQPNLTWMTDAVALEVSDDLG